MRIPLPSCYFAEDDSRKHIVIDGVQRLTTIQRFFNDEFALEGLTAFKELEGKKFSELEDYQAELESTTIRCIILRKENPKKLIREIFSRLNQGAVALSGQEIRHAIYPGKLDDLLMELSKIPLIANFGVGPNSEKKKDSHEVKKKDSREAEEQVLRFFAFYEGLDNYESKLTRFLDEKMEQMVDIEEEDISRMRLLFMSCLENCKAVFGDAVFTDTTKQRRKQGIVYYDLLMPSVGLLEKDVVAEKLDAIREAFSELCRSEEFKRTLSGGLQMKIPFYDGESCGESC
jgi:Protein of unknown function DUF262